MSLTQNTKIITSFKKTVGKAQTDILKKDYNESEFIKSTISSNRVFVQAIDPNPSQAVIDGTVLSIFVDLIEDETSNGHSYFAVYRNDIPSLGVLAGDRVENIISPLHGIGYEVEINTSSYQIYLGDPAGWFFQYEAGVFFQEEVAHVPTEASLYVYSGTTLESLANDAATITGDNISKEEFSENLLPSTTDDIEIYVNTPGDAVYSGNDITGNGLEATPYATLEKALSVVAYSKFTEFSLIIYLGAGVFTITNEYINLLKTLKNINSSIEIIGTGEITHTVSLTTIANRNYHTFTGSTVVENGLRKKFIKSGTDLFPIAYNSPTGLYAPNAATAGSEIVELQTTLVFANNQLNASIDANSISGLVINGCIITKSGDITLTETLKQTQFISCLINKNLVLSGINKYILDKCYVFGTIIALNTNLRASNTVFSPSDTVKDSGVSSALYAQKSNIDISGVIIQNCNTALEALESSNITDSNENSITIRECNYLTTLKSSHVALGLSDTIEIQDVTNFSSTLAANIEPNVYFSLSAANIIGVLPPTTGYKTTQVDKNIFIFVKGITENYFKSTNNIIYSTKAEVTNLGSSSAFVGCIETGTLYKYISNGSSYIVDNVKILLTADGGNTRFVAITEESKPKEKVFTSVNTITVTHTLGKYPDVIILIETAPGELEKSYGKVIYLSTSSFRVEFGSLYTGKIIYS